MNPMETVIREAEDSLLHTYNRFPVVFDHGEGVRLYDTEGKEYLDFCAGIAVHALGYGNRDFNEALSAQLKKLTHTSNYFYNEPAVRAAKALKRITGLDKVFFTNSGAEAVEGAIKAARKYAWLKDHTTDHEIIAMEHSFHGRTMGALSVTGNSAYQEPFLPMIGNIRYAVYNDLDSVKELINDRTCAVILETVQGEGGIIPATKEFLAGVRKLCDENGLLLILDEIQCGMGRSGEMFAYELYGVSPDIVTVAKGIGSGIPVGAFVLSGEVAAHSLAAGDHGTTYGGTPFAACAVDTVIAQFEKLKLTDRVKETGKYLGERLEELVKEYDFILEARGVGLMRGIELSADHPVSGICKSCLQNGLVLVSAGRNTLRFLPPLIVTKEEIDEMIEILRRSF